MASSPDIAAESRPVESAPALWNPQGAMAWSLILTWGFGAYLVAQNWKALGEPEKARRAMWWFYSVFVFLLAAFVTPDDATTTQIFRAAGVGLFATWALSQAQPQIKFVEQQFGKSYPRKSWLAPIGVALGGTLAVLGAFFFMAGAFEGPQLTFAESVDPATFERRNEGSEFRVGPVAMVLDGFSGFGDSMVIVSFRPTTETAWQKLGELNVEPDWNVLTMSITLPGPGDYIVSVKTSDGRALAEGPITIRP